MTGLGWALILLETLVTLASLFIAWRSAAARPRGLHTGPQLAVPFVPPGKAGTSARRRPRGVETRAAAGGAPDGEGTWSSPPPPGAARRPVNGRSLGRKPRQVPAWQPVVPQETPDSAPWDTPTGSQPALTAEAEALEAERAAAHAAGLRARGRVGTVPRPVLERVKTRLLEEEVTR